MSGPSSHDDELIARITRALHSREPDQPDAAVVEARLRARLAQLPETTVTTFARRGTRIAAAGVVTSVLAVAGAGAAAAANPYSNAARVLEGVVQSVGINWSAMPDGYTREQYEAFWAAGFTGEDIDALEALWNTDTTATKARAGQLILDGLPVPVAPGSAGTAPMEIELEAFWDAGYTFDDVEELAELWHIDQFEAKARAGRMILDGEPLPLD